MKTFYEFIEDKKINQLKEQAANLMAELDIDPIEFVLEYVSKNPQLETIQEGLMDSLGRIKDAAVQFGKRVWSGGKEGFHQAKDTIMGPHAKFDTAMKVLNDLVKSLENNVATKDMIAGDDPAHPWARGKKISDYINDMINQLRVQKPFIPKMQPRQDFDRPQMVQPGNTPPGP